MADGKWIDGLHADTPLADAARRVLAVRLEVVRDKLPLAMHKPDEDIEHVHHLRVGTRRAGAALEIFAPCLPDKVHKKARKQLRRIRQAAGEARDWDVFLTSLQEREQGRPERERVGLDFLFGYAQGQRIAAQADLEAAVPEEPLQFDQLLSESVAAVRDPRSGQQKRTLVDWAQPLLLDLLRELDEAASQDLGDYEHLHQVRIIGKRLRYAMEVFADCFIAPFREEIYPAVEQMQDILGRANDSHVAVQRLTILREKLKKAWRAEWKRVQPGVESLLRFHQRRLPQERKQFVKWWDRWQVSGAETALTALLKAPRTMVS